MILFIDMMPQENAIVVLINGLFEANQNQTMYINNSLFICCKIDQDSLESA